MAPERAIIDIGSNTVRLVMYAGPPRAPRALLNEKVTAKLGRGVSETGLLSGKAMAAALGGLARYQALIGATGVSEVDVVATAAVRDAANGEQFLDAIRALGLRPRLLSGEEEAITSAHGVMAALPGAKGIVGDLGGGSLELVDVDGDQCAHGISLPLGTLNLPELRMAGPAQFNRKVTKILQKADLAAGRGLPLYLVGGSFRAFARYAISATAWPLDDPHGFELSTNTAIDLAETLNHSRGTQPLQVPGLSASRLGSLPDASALLGILAQAIGPSKLVFSSWGLGEGLIYRSLEPDVRMQDPMLAGSAAFTEGQGIPARQATMVAGWTALARQSSGTGGENLRLAATMLSLASLQLEPNLRSEHAVDWALRKRWIGIDCEGRAMLAAAVLANGGRTAAALELDRLAPAESLREAAIWGTAIRLCRRLAGNTAISLSSSRLSVSGDQLLLSVRQPLDVLFTDAVDKDLRALARMLELEPVFEALPQSDEDRTGAIIPGIETAVKAPAL